MTQQQIMSGILVEETSILTLDELSRASGQPAEWILTLVEEGVIEPVSKDDGQWKFYGLSLRRVRIVKRLKSDLGVNLAGAALALQLLEELETLRKRIAALDP